MKIRSDFVAVAALVLSMGAAMAETVITDDSRMTLYTYDKDEGGKSTCYSDCTKSWRPYTGAENASKGEGWTLVERYGGAMQWAYDGKPTYLFTDDEKPGDARGDGKDGLWHALKE